MAHRATASTFEGLSEPILRGSCHNLRTLTLSHVDLFERGEYKYKYVSHLTDIVGEFTLLAGHVNKLRSIVMTIKICVSDEQFLEKASTDAIEQCNKLDELLAGPNFPSLQRLRLSVHFTVPEDPACWRYLNCIGYNATVISVLRRFEETCALAQKQCFRKLRTTAPGMVIEFNLYTNLVALRR